jgi:oligoribonuclease NrnB/cAMP/cGMP phosphodiesterase (DHH superfamily)
MTISLGLLKQVQTIVTHKDCPDGMASAILLHEALPGAQLRFIQYNTKELEELPAKPGMLFCDITPTPKRNQEFVDAGALVLDHHKGAQEQVAAFNKHDDLFHHAVFADEKSEPGTAGALLAYRHVWFPLMQERGALVESESARALEFAVIAGVRDTWQTESKLWVKSCEQAEALRFFPPEMLLELERPFGLSWDVFEDMLAVGELLMQKKKVKVERALKGAWTPTIYNGTRIVAFNGMEEVSDAAEVVGNKADLVIGFRYEIRDSEDAALILSVRSHTGFDCAKLAKFYDGGGHTAAAGFSYKFEPTTIGRDPYGHIEALVSKYLEQAGQQ